MEMEQIIENGKIAIVMCRENYGFDILYEGQDIWDWIINKKNEETTVFNMKHIFTLCRRWKKSPQGWIDATLVLLLLAVLLVFAVSPAPVHTAAETTVTHIHTNISGNPLAASDEDGSLLWKESYQPFGARTQQNQSSAQQTQWFHGKAQDATSGLQYFGARWYDPEIGRFLGLDPVGFQDGNLHSFNRYAYGNNNPLRYVDPDGNDATAAFGGLLTEGYNLATGNGFNGDMVWGALLDGYNGEGAGFLRSAGRDFLNFGGGSAAADVAIKGFNAAKNALGIGRVNIPPGKFEYIFGRVTSSIHSANRSSQLAAAMRRLGISDTAAGQKIIAEHLSFAARSEGNVIRKFSNNRGNFEVKDSLFMVPSGKAVKLESTFQVLQDGSRKFITTIPHY